MKLLDVLIVGCGNIAGGFDANRPSSDLPLTHAGAFSRNPGFALAACVEPNDAKREAFMARWNIPTGFASLTQAIAANLRPKVVSICSPTAAHANDIQTALALKPRIIFCEKPITMSAGETEHWVNTCQQSGVLLAVNHTRRWAPDVIRLKTMLDSGEWGRLRSMNAVYNKGILNNGGHMIDLVQYLAGPLAVLCAGMPVRDHWSDDPTVPALMSTAEGVPFSLNIAHASDYAIFELELVMANGVLTMENGGMNWRVRRTIQNPFFQGYHSLGPATETAGEYTLAMSAAVANVYGAATCGEPLASDGISALSAQRICQKIREAAVAPQEKPI